MEKVGLLAADQQKLKVKIDLQEMKVEPAEVRKAVQDPRWGWPRDWTDYPISINIDSGNEIFPPPQKHRGNDSHAAAPCYDGVSHHFEGHLTIVSIQGLKLYIAWTTTTP